MELLRRFGANSAIYAAVGLLQKGALFLLLPLYTLYLEPQGYGIVAIVTSINGLLAVLFTLGLTSAATRFYFEYRDDPEALAEFWGTMLVAVLLLSAMVGGVLLLFGERLLGPWRGQVAFWPYVALGVLATFFQPFFTTFLAILQARNQAGLYAAVSLGHFATTAALTVAFLVLLGSGAEGALIATLIAAAAFFVLSLVLLRRNLTWCLKWHHLKPALAYSLPQVPHMAAAQINAVADRLVINARLGTAPAGLYAAGALVALVVEIAAGSVNRAYVPLSMDALQSRRPDQLAQLRVLGDITVAGFCLLGLAVAAFSIELVALFAAPAFAPAAAVVPLLAYAGVASAIYYLLVSILFFDRGATRWIPVGTLTAAGINVALAWVLLPVLGLIGAAVAALAGQVVATLLIGTIGRAFDPVKWPYARYAACYVAGLVAALALGSLRPELPLGLLVAAKLAALLGFTAVLGLLMWNRPLILLQAALRLVGRRGPAASDLFIAKRQVSP